MRAFKAWIFTILLLLSAVFSEAANLQQQVDSTTSKMVGQTNLAIPGWFSASGLSTNGRPNLRATGLITNGIFDGKLYESGWTNIGANYTMAISNLLPKVRYTASIFNPQQYTVTLTGIGLADWIAHPGVAGVATTNGLWEIQFWIDESSSVAKTNIVDFTPDLKIQAAGRITIVQKDQNTLVVSNTPIKGFIVLTHPHNTDNTGAILQTNDVTAPYFGEALFSNSAAAAGNYVEYRLTVPEDLDTTADLKVERWKFRLSGADTGTHRYVISMGSIADSAAYVGTLGNSVNLDFAGDGAGANGDVETVANVTLTNWKANLTAGQLWVIRIARDGSNGADASTVNSYSGPLVISYQTQ